MRLFHATTAEAAAWILEEGFAVSHVGDSVGRSWLSARIEEATSTSAGHDVVVVVTLPDEIAEQYRSRFPDGELYLDNYLVPWEVLNAARPFEVVTLPGRGQAAGG